jgi:hypothetical protein
VPSVSINVPPCPGGTVRLDHQYSGTYDANVVGEPPDQKRATIKVKVKLRVGIKDQDGGLYETPECEANVGGGNWNFTFVNVPPGRSARITAQLYLDDVAAGAAKAIEDFIARNSPSAPTSCIETDTKTSGHHSETSARGGRGDLGGAVEGAIGSRGAPPGYESRLFHGTYEHVPPQPPIRTIRCRIERRYPSSAHPECYTRRITLSTALIVPFAFGRWHASLLVPTTRPETARDFFIAEFFSPDGLYAQTADVREIT